MCHISHIRRFRRADAFRLAIDEGLDVTGRVDVFFELGID